MPDSFLCRQLIQSAGTSKFPPGSDIHGCHGSFLAAVAALSLLSITSHHHNYHSHNSLIIHNSAILARHLPSPPEHRLLSFSHGTRVTVRDLFGNMPVRVKQRAVDIERGVTSKDWESLKRVLVALLLAWPHQVSIILRDSRNQQSVSIRSPEPTTNRQIRDEGYDVVSRGSSVLQQAHLLNDAPSETWVPLRASAGHMVVLGAASLAPVATKRVQFISIGVQPVSNEHGSNILYEEINKMFINSSFGVEEEGEEIDEEEQRRRREDGRYKTEGYTDRELKARKGVDRWPMFYIKLNLEGRAAQLAGRDVDEILDERRESLKAIIDLLKAVFYEFLKRYHFRPRRFRPSRSLSLGPPRSHDAREKSSSRNSTPRPSSQISQALPSRSKTPAGDLATTRLTFTRTSNASKSRLNSDSPFDLWTRIKSGRPSELALHRKATPESSSTTPKLGIARPLLEPPKCSSAPPFLDHDNNVLNAPSLNIDLHSNTPELNQDSINDGRTTQEPESPADKGTAIWINPATKERTIIDSRTGFVIEPLQNGGENLEGTDSSARPRPTKRLRLPTQPAPKDEKSPWLRDVLASWENPVFQSTEPPIPVAFDETKVLGTGSDCHGCHGFTWTNKDFSDNIRGKISKDALRQAEVIAQVDRKFILAKVSMAGPGIEPATAERPNTSLIIIDQHAADERCRVETLLGEYFETVEGNPSPDRSVVDTVPTQQRPAAVVRARAEVLEKPLKFDISTTDALQFGRLADHFRRWGIWYEVDDYSPQPLPATTSKSQGGRGGRPSQQLKIQKLPPSIAERCRLEPRLLIELLRKEAWKEQEPNGAAGEHDRGDGGGDSSRHWLARLHGCPQAILDMINSRACRSAIMFNDELSRAECVGLVRRLADCALPFQCAHGRPSMVPLLDLGSGGAGGGAVGLVDGVGWDVVRGRGRGKGEGSFGREFGRWMERKRRVAKVARMEGASGGGREWENRRSEV